jgi:hypothetical protein
MIFVYSLPVINLELKPYDTYSEQQIFLCMISGIRRHVNEIFALQGCYTA